MTLQVRHQLVLLLVVATLIRLGFAAALGLGVDESYMVASGRALSLGYFDHPPASWWLAWAASHLAGTEAPIVVRLPFIALFALSTWLMARLGAAIAGERAGLWAAVLLNLSPVFGVTTGTWVLPDGPLDCALLGAALCLVHALPAQADTLPRCVVGRRRPVRRPRAVLEILRRADAGRRVRLPADQPRTPALAGPPAALSRRRCSPLLVFSPVIVWNATHHWASFAFQGERAAAGARFHPLGPLIVLGGEALFVLPWIWAPMMALFVAALRRGPAAWRSWLLACLAAPPIVLFALVAAWSSQRVLFHWAAPGYLMLFPLLGEAVATRLPHPWVRRTLPAPRIRRADRRRRRHPGAVRLAAPGDRRAWPARTPTWRRSTGPRCAPTSPRAACWRPARWSACRTGATRERSPTRWVRTSPCCA